MDSRKDSPNSLLNRAQSDFDTALRKGSWRQILSALTRRSNQLLPYDQVLKLLPISGQHYAGIRQVPIDAIIGSVGRFQDFDRAFLPRGTSTRERWEQIDIAHRMDVDLPAIELYKLGEVYFVKDGNHRVSVARERGQAFIDAIVVEVDSPVPVTQDTNLVDLIGKRELTRFFKKTELYKTRPGADIRLSLPEMYAILLDHVQTHGWFLNEEREESLSFTEIAIFWYDNVYLPMIQIIREKGILAGFPHRTEADLYVWIMEHRWFLMQDTDADVSMEDAADHFLDSYSKKPWQKIFYQISRIMPQRKKQQ
jgi:hypothetical protein